MQTSIRSIRKAQWRNGAREDWSSGCSSQSKLLTLHYSTTPLLQSSQHLLACISLPGDVLVMSWSIPIARIAGIQLRIHVTFVLLIAWLGLGYYASGGSAAATIGVLFILLLFLCVVLHEF